MESTHTEQKVNGAAQVVEVKEAPKKNLVQKLAEVMAAVGYLQKTGWNKSQEYHYATEADVADMMRAELAKRNVFIFPNLVKNERTRIERTKYDKVAISYATDVEIDWTFVDGDSGEERTCRIPGCSESPGDKGVYVAMTGSEKYLLMKSFLIPTGDDPEHDSNEPRGTKEAAKAVGEKKLEELKEKLPDGPVLDGMALYYTWFEASKTAKITGSAQLMKASEDLLKPLKLGKELIANENQLEDLKWKLAQRNIPFKLFKTVKA